MGEWGGVLKMCFIHWLGLFFVGMGGGVGVDFELYYYLGFGGKIL